MPATGSESLDGIPTIFDRVEYSKISWEDKDGNKGNYNLTGSLDSGKLLPDNIAQYLVYDTPEYVGRHRLDDWYDQDYDYSDDWLEDGTEVQNVKVLNNKDYYDYLMKLFADEQSGANREVPADTRLRKSLRPDVPAEEPEKTPCTDTTMGFCNLFFTLVFTTVIVVAAICAYFGLLLCYVKVSFAIYNRDEGNI